MRFAIVGAGAIGGFVGACLARSGAEVTLIARGAHMAAMRDRGVVVHDGADTFTVHPRVESSLAAIAGADVVILALKAHQLAQNAAELAAHLPADAALVAMQNGIPWWYFQRIESPLEGLVLEAVDPKRRIIEAIDYAHIIGCVVYASCEVIEPGVILHGSGKRFSLGEPSGALSDRVQRIAQAFSGAGLQAPVEANIRKEIWSKLLGNAAYNPISALTRSTTGEMLEDVHVVQLVREVMQEATRLARAVGVSTDITIEKRIEASRRYANVRSSMLQDLLAARPLELEPLIGAIVELGERIGVDVTATRHIYALAKLLDAGTTKKSIVART